MRQMTVRMKLPVLHGEPTNHEGTLLRQLVVRSTLIHPDWDARTIASYLVNDEFMKDYEPLLGDEERMFAEWGEVIEKYRQLTLENSTD